MGLFNTKNTNIHNMAKFIGILNMSKNIYYLYSLTFSETKVVPLVAVFFTAGYTAAAVFFYIE